MKIVYFTHSLRSCWNHGNAHFLRGVLAELVALGHEVHALEPEHSWSLSNLLDDHGEAALEAFRQSYPELSPDTYSPDADWDELVEGADLVLVHEWNDPELVRALGRVRRRGGRFVLLFHDTHHRAVSAPADMQSYDLEDYDGILAFGEAVSRIYRDWGWGERAFTWHEAADIRRFYPPAEEGKREGLIWIGNWGDGERSEELVRFLLRPAMEAGLPLDIHGVRYPPEARAVLRDHGARYLGWLANAAAPTEFARRLATVHVPRRYYSQVLPGIPTIRVFEALACGIPLVSAPWSDCEDLFRVGEDFLMVSSGDEMVRELVRLKNDGDLRRSLQLNGLETIRKRHTCGHRAEELMRIYADLRRPANAVAA